MWKRIRGSSSGSDSPVHKLIKSVSNFEMTSDSPREPHTSTTEESRNQIPEFKKMMEIMILQNADLKSTLTEHITKVKTDLKEVLDEKYY